MKKKPASDYTFQIASSKCNECLLSANKIVSDERRKQILERCLQIGDEKYFICHKASQAGKDVCCYGFYQTYGDRVTIIQLAQRLGFISFIDVETLDQLESEVHNSTVSLPVDQPGSVTHENSDKSPLLKD